MAITYRLTKGSALTYQELDDNFLYLENQVANVISSNGSGTVTSVGLTSTNGINISGSPITTFGNIDINIVAGTGVVSNSSGVHIGQSVGTTDDVTFANVNATYFIGDGSQLTNLPTTGTVTSVGITAGNLIDVTGSPITTSGSITIDVDLSELTTSTADADGDFFVVVDSVNAQKKLTKANIAISGFNNDAGYSTTVGTVTSIGISEGNGISVVGSPITSSGNISVSVVAGNTQIVSNTSGIWIDQTQIDHDSLSNFVSNEHINHTSVTLTAGNGLTGGGDISSNRSFSVVAGTGVVSNSSGVHIGQSVGTTDDVQFANVTSSFFIGNGSQLTNLNATNISTGTLDSARLPELTVADFANSAITDSTEPFSDVDTKLMTAAAIDDRIISYGYSTTVGTVTSVGLTGGDGIDVSGSPITSSGTLTLSIADNGISGDKIDGGIISNFTSTGIDDNATQETLQISDSLITLGASQAGAYTIARGRVDQSLFISGGSGASLGANFVLYGETSTNPGDIRIRSSSANLVIYDGGTSDHYWHNNLGTIGAVWDASANTLGIGYATAASIPTTGKLAVNGSMSATGKITSNTLVVALVANTAAELVKANTEMVVYYDGSYWSYDATIANTNHTFDTANGIMIGPSSTASGAWLRDVGDGVLNVKWFGASANAGGDSLAAFDMAIAIVEKANDYTNTSDGFAYLRKWSSIIFVPGNSDYSSGIITPSTRTTYTVSGPIVINGSNIIIRGESRTMPRISFNNHSHGFVFTNDEGDTAANQYIGLENLYIKGSAPSANSTSGANFCSVGLYVSEMSKSVFRDLYIEDFVDAIVINANDPNSTPAGTITGRFENIFVDQNYWPNQYNQGPRFGVNSLNNGGKPIISSTNSAVSSSGTLELEVTSHGLSNDDVVSFFDLVGGNGLRPFSRANNFNYDSTDRNYYVQVIDANNVEIWKGLGGTTLVGGTNVTSGYITEDGMRTNKMQGFVFDKCTIYSQITGKEVSYTGDGVTTDFDITVGAGTFGLSAATGIKVFVKEDGIYVAKVHGVDYDLIDSTIGSGSTVIGTTWDARYGTMATSNNGYNITTLTISFNTAPASPNNIRILRNDPYGVCGYHWPIGSANKIDGGEVGGYRTGVQLGGYDQFNILQVADENTVQLEYMQLTDTAFVNGDPATNLTSGILTIREFSQKAVTDYVDGFSGWVIDDVSPHLLYKAKVTSDVVLTGTYADVCVMSIPNSRPGTHRHITGSLDISFADTASADAYVEFKIEWAENDATTTWTGLKYAKIQNTITALANTVTTSSNGIISTSVTTIDMTTTQQITVPISIYHDVAVDNYYGIVNDIQYRVQARVVGAGDSATIEGSSASSWSGIIGRVVNP